MDHSWPNFLLGGLCQSTISSCNYMSFDTLYFENMFLPLKYPKCSIQDAASTSWI